MRQSVRSLFLFLACVGALPAMAQMEEVVVTGARISGDDYSRMPAIVLERRADFLVQRVQLTNDTRSAEVRTKEIQQTIRDMLADAGKRQGIALGYGEEFLNTFVKKARVSERTEVEPVDDVGLSLVTPEKYRYDIIARITEDAKRLQSAVGSQCKVEISGLSNRVSWQRSDISELTLYIPCQVQLTGCQ